MTPARLELIRRANKQWKVQVGDWRTIDVADMTDELLVYVDELTRQRDDARDMVVRSGYFTNLTGVEYVGQHKPDHTQYPPSETRPMRASDRPGNARCECHWCNGAGPT